MEINSSASLSEMNSLTQDIETLASSKHLKEAKGFLSMLLEQYPDNVGLHLRYAKILYWDGKIILAKKEIEKYKQHDKKLYHKIYLAWVINQLSKGKNAQQKIVFFQKQPLYIQESYDVKWIAIASYIKLKHFKKALTLAEGLHKKYLKSREAHERFASLLFWNHHIEKSLDEYTALSKKYGKQRYLKQIKQLQNIRHHRKSKKKNIKEI